jgi:hypothetical protein
MPSSQKALMDAATKRAEKLEANGKALDFKELLRMEPDSGTTNNPQREQRTGSAGWPLRTAAWCPSPASPNTTP